MLSQKLKFITLGVCLFLLCGFKLKDEGAQVNPNVQELNCVGAGITCAGGGMTSTVTAVIDESGIEAVVDLQDLQGAVTDAQVPNNITITANGSDTQFIYNDGGVYNGSPNLLFDDTNQIVTIKAKAGLDYGFFLVTDNSNAALFDCGSGGGGFANNDGVCSFNESGLNMNVHIFGGSDDYLLWADGGNDSITIGSQTEIAKFGIDGNADEIQFAVQGHSTQTSNLVVFEKSDGTDVFTVTNVGNVTMLGDLTITGDDLFMATNTSGAALIADGTNFNPVVISGDVAIGSTGTATIQANSVALGTDTTGGYAGSSTEGGAATTATALAANGSNCSSGSYPLGVDASGASESCATVSGSEINNLSTITTGIATTQLAIGTGANTAAYAALSGDVTMTNAGVVTIAANSVALSTDTTGNYAAGDAEAGNALTGDSATAFFSTGTLEIAIGGTGSAPASDDQILVSDSSSAATWRSLSSCSNATTSKVLYNTSTNSFSCGTDQDSGGSTAWSSIGDAAADGSVAFGGTTQILDANTNDVTAITQNVLEIDFTNDAGTDVLTQTLLYIKNLSATGGTTDNLLVLDNADNSTVTTGMKILGSSSGAITTAIDASDAEIGVALAIGANSITMADGAIENWSGVTTNTATEGLILPTYNSGGTAEGQCSWDPTNDILYCGNGTISAPQNLTFLQSQGAGASATRYTPVGGYNSDATEANVDNYQLPHDCIMQNFTATIDNNPNGVGKSWDVTLRDDASSTTLTCNIPNGSTNCTDVTHRPTVGNGSKLAILWTRNSTADSPGLMSATWECVPTEGVS